MFVISLLWIFVWWVIGYLILFCFRLLLVKVCDCWVMCLLVLVVCLLVVFVLVLVVGWSCRFWWRRIVGLEFVVCCLLVCSWDGEWRLVRVVCWVWVVLCLLIFGWGDIVNGCCWVGFFGSCLIIFFMMNLCLMGCVF